MRYTKVLNTEQMNVMFNGVLAVLSLIMIIFIAIILFEEVVGIISTLYLDKKTKKSEYQKGYEDGLREGLSIANELMEEFLEEHQERMDRLLFNEGEEI